MFEAFTNLSIDEEVAEVMAYAVDEFSQHGRLNPLMTMYHHAMKILTLYFPDATQEYSRQEQMADACFTPSLLKASSSRFIVDAQVGKNVLRLGNDLSGEDELIDSLFCLFSTSNGVHIAPLPYAKSEDGLQITWHDRTTMEVDKKFIFDDHPYLLSFSAMQFFIENNLVPWKSYLHYLEMKGFQIVFHAPYTEENFAFGA